MDRYCDLTDCRFAYKHYYGADVCGSPDKEKTVDITNAEAYAAEEPLADWERELLKPDPNAVVHMLPAEGQTACDTKLDDGGIHLITGNLAGVTCDPCKIKTLTYYNEQLQAMVNQEKEKTRVANQATGMVRTELRVAQRVNSRQRQDITCLRREVDYLNGQHDSPHNYSVDGRGHTL